jgi:glucosamine 6-phosphate synthetase-like amidotransferase/phosphosugar isomerase protein
MMEFSLLISGIRPGSLPILLENSLIEFNMGIPFFYLLYDKLNSKNTCIIFISQSGKTTESVVNAEIVLKKYPKLKKNTITN